jgi:isopenicillin N synthase-like dioxygenase
MPRHDLIKTFEDEIAPFHRLVWDAVIRKLLVLFAIILELPENYFVERHHYEEPSEDHLRYVSPENPDRPPDSKAELFGS